MLCWRIRGKFCELHFDRRRMKFIFEKEKR